MKNRRPSPGIVEIANSRLKSILPKLEPKLLLLILSYPHPPGKLVLLFSFAKE